MDAWLFVLAAIVGIIAGASTLWGLVSRGVFGGLVRSKRHIDAELAAKDKTIITYEQTTKALEARIEQLEDQAARLKESVDTANAAVASLKARYDALELFAAPAAFHVIDVKLDALLEQHLTPDQRALVEAKLGASR